MVTKKNNTQQVYASVNIGHWNGNSNEISIVLLQQTYNDT